MSSEPVQVEQNQADASREIKIISHSAIFYWWPVWAVGFVMTIITWIDGGRMAVVPSGTVAVKTAPVAEGETNTWFAQVVDDPDGKGQPLNGRYLLVAPPDKELEPASVRIAHNKNLGVVFTITLLLIVLVTNIPMRGLWAFIVVLLVVLLTVIFALAGWWGQMLEYISILKIYLNMGGYLFISLGLFIAWAIVVFGFDRRTYVVVSSGQLRHCQAIGQGEKVYDTTGMTFHKRQDDLFRHWIIGLGSGDLVVQKSATHEEIDMPNVLFIGSNIKKIERLIKERAVVS